MPRLIHSGLMLIATSSRRARAAIALASACRGVDFFGQLAKLHRRLGPAAAFGDELFEFAAELLLSGEQRAKFRLFFPRVEQAQPRAFEHVDHIVERDAIQARSEPVEPLGGGRVAQRVELLHLAQADGENVDVRRLVDVFERFAQQAVALLFAVGRDDRDFADVVRPAVGVAADRQRAVIGFHFEPTAGAAAVRPAAGTARGASAKRRTAPTA